MRGFLFGSSRGSRKGLKFIPRPIGGSKKSIHHGHGSFGVQNWGFCLLDPPGVWELMILLRPTCNYRLLAVNHGLLFGIVAFFWGLLGFPSCISGLIYYLDSKSMWMVVKIMVTAGVLSIIRHLEFRGPKGDQNLDNHPCTVLAQHIIGYHTMLNHPTICHVIPP